MHRHAWLFAFLFLSLGAARAQWQIEASHTTAGLRGIDYVGNGVAWASGANGTVLRTLDDGSSWQACAIPPGAERLDFRGIQAFDANTAIVMSSGKGYLSRLYKTTDGCRTWKLIFTNPDEEGFLDAVYKAADQKLYVLGNPVHGTFAMFLSEDAGDTWFAAGEAGRSAHPGSLAFAASNSALTGWDPYLTFGTGGSASVYVYTTGVKCFPPPGHPNGLLVFNCTVEWKNAEAPIASESSTSGIFSLATRPFTAKDGVQTAVVVAVGGDCAKPDQSAMTAAWSIDGGEHWTTPQTPPHGFRSAVAYDAAAKTWITVGPNGTDISTDDGRNWRALHPDPALHEASGADRDWNALSLPFVVGPHGRIGKLSPHTLVAARSNP